MSDIVGYFVVAIIVAVIAFGVTIGFRSFTNTTTPIMVSEVRPGVYCALATTTDGVAIDCWQEQ